MRPWAAASTTTKNTTGASCWKRSDAVKKIENMTMKRDNAEIEQNIPDMIEGAMRIGEKTADGGIVADETIVEDGTTEDDGMIAEGTMMAFRIVQWNRVP